MEIRTGHVLAASSNKSDAKQTIAYLEKEKVEGNKSFVALLSHREALHSFDYQQGCS
jgi:hypothetical protein